jgi:RsiW-degrading membrane proteinase PrsW (M82 family)
MYPVDPLAQTVVVKPSGNRRAATLALAVAGALVALMLGLLTLLFIGVATGPVAFLIGFVFATLPVPIYLALVLWVDRYESEPLWALATTFLWGAMVAVFIAFVINTISGGIVAAILGKDAGNFFSAVISAPIVEEGAKALVLFGIYFWKHDEFDGVVDGIVYASMVGLGFAMTENIQYYGQAALEGGIGGSMVLFILRGAMAPFSHPLFTSMTGIGLGLASQSNKRSIKTIMPALGLVCAMGLHSLWNITAALSQQIPLLFFLAYFFLMVPIFTGVLVAIFFALRREGRIVREHLLCDFQRGLLHQQEYECLCSIRGRIGASLAALTKGGPRVWRARMRYNRVASDLAFHRSRISRGILPGDVAAAQREAAYLQVLRELRAQLGPY